MRYTMLAHSNPAAAATLLEQAQADVAARWSLYEHWANVPVGPAPAQTVPSTGGATQEGEP
jgi:hypothetical protein